MSWVLKEVPWLGSGSMGVCKYAGEEMGTMVGLAIKGQ